MGQARQTVGLEQNYPHYLQYHDQNRKLDRFVCHRYHVVQQKHQLALPPVLQLNSQGYYRYRTVIY